MSVSTISHKVSHEDSSNYLRIKTNVGSRLSCGCLDYKCFTNIKFLSLCNFFSTYKKQ